jgi:hypothetical protein
MFRDLFLAANSAILIGLIGRGDRTVLRMGYDSLSAFLLYGAGVAVLYSLK